MKHSFNPGRTVLGALLSCIALTTLSALPAFAADAGQFPAISSSYLKTGDFIGPDHVRRITPGLSKDQVRLELGSPHFSEGIFSVREWDYAFNFHTGRGNNEYETCQYKVQFDKDYRVAATLWQISDCAGYIAAPVAARAAIVVAPAPVPAMAPPPPPVARVTAPPPPARRRIVLTTDGVFAFGKSSMNDFGQPGREKLDALVNQLRQETAMLFSMTVTGHTDRIGSDAANLALSRARAETVRAYLVKAGVDGQRVQARGVGESNPVADCPGKKVTPQLVACLQPNRRVEIEIVAEK